MFADDGSSQAHNRPGADAECAWRRSEEGDTGASASRFTSTSTSKRDCGVHPKSKWSFNDPAVQERSRLRDLGLNVSGAEDGWGGETPLNAPRLTRGRGRAAMARGLLVGEGRA